jgi:hypothetical protein
MGWKPSYSAPKSPQAWAVDPRRPHALKRSAASTAFQPCPPGIRAVPLRRVFEPGIGRPLRNLARVIQGVYPEAVPFDVSQDRPGRGGAQDPDRVYLFLETR